MRELSLFTGAGGGLLGSLILGFRTVAAVEIDPYCQRVLCARGGYMANAEHAGPSCERAGLQSEGAFNQPLDADREVGRGFPVHGDIRTFHPIPGSCDIVTGGFPCQPFSQAGKRLGEDDPRNMWPHALRVLRESGAPLGLFENVPGLLSARRGICTLHWKATRGYAGRQYCPECRRRVPASRILWDYYFPTILADLAAEGFDAEWCVLGADDVGAPHRRKRLCILAYSQREQLQGIRSREGLGRRSDRSDSPWWCDPADVPDSECGGRESARERRGLEGMGGRGSDDTVPTSESGPHPEGFEDEWLLEPYVGRVATGVASRVDRLRALGNGQVPQTMAAAFTYLAREAGVLGWDGVTTSVPTATRHDETD